MEFPPSKDARADAVRVEEGLEAEEEGERREMLVEKRWAASGGWRLALAKLVPPTALRVTSLALPPFLTSLALAHMSMAPFQH